jgi:hypothetical protein
MAAATSRKSKALYNESRNEDQLRQRVGAGDLDLVSLERVDGLQ